MKTSDERVDDYAASDPQKIVEAVRAARGSVDGKEHLWLAVYKASEMTIVEIDPDATPRKMYQQAFASQAEGVVLVGNRVRGNKLSPSYDELLTTCRLVVMGDTLGLPMYDRLIIADVGDAWVSLRKSPEVEGAWAALGRTLARHVHAAPAGVRLAPKTEGKVTLH